MRELKIKEKKRLLQFAYLVYIVVGLNLAEGPITFQSTHCKRHKWRVGTGIGVLVKGKLQSIGSYIWCEKCNKRLKAYYGEKK